jgi:hypothetical protein
MCLSCGVPGTRCGPACAPHAPHGTTWPRSLQVFPRHEKPPLPGGKHIWDSFFFAGFLNISQDKFPDPAVHTVRTRCTRGGHAGPHRMPGTPLVVCSLMMSGFFCGEQHLCHCPKRIVGLVKVLISTVIILIADKMVRLHFLCA